MKEFTTYSDMWGPT